MSLELENKFKKISLKSKLYLPITDKFLKYFLKLNDFDQKKVIQLMEENELLMKKANPYLRPPQPKSLKIST